ncbi:MAG: 16S rRNA (uracil(1498)-N(3))-methyltransferase [Hyphomicrobiaceae bacterium]|nr:16S rRNA (uracil(1498)-N(3))-methyltransferase [Hyphomicrobiaceae bacterium]
MAVHDFTSERLFLEASLAPDASLTLTSEQAHYLLNVLRMSAGGEILIFNGRDGEWRARLEDVTKRAASLRVMEQIRPQSDGPAIHYLFAPLKHARLDYMIQKAVEMGVARLSPVMTHRTVPGRVNAERMRRNAIEAAEQCGVLRVPEIDDIAPLAKSLDAWDPDCPLIFCDEDAAVTNPVSALEMLKPGPVGVLIGPEGGFDAEERRLLLSKSFVTAISLGPRIMRADTAAVAALTLVNATLGDWR